MADARLERLRSVAFEGGGVLALASLLLYAWLAPSHIVDGDNAEFATLGTIGGAAHPSGYPAYLLWLRATSWLPGTPAHATALATAILGAASIWVLYAACRAWGAKPLAATLAVMIFAGSPMTIRTGVRAEVFALNDLVVAAVLWLAAREGPLRGSARGFALGLVAGLGLANHMTCTLVAPLGILGVVRAAREARGRGVAFAVLGLVVGLLPYLYLFATPDTAMSWGKVHSVEDLVAMVTRRDYGGAFAFSPARKETDHVAHLLLFAATLARTWLWAPLALALFTLIHGIRRNGHRETRAAWALLATSWLVAGPVLALRFNLEPDGLGRYVVQRFHVLPALLLAIPLAIGLTRLAPWFSNVRIRESTACALAATLVFFLVAAPSLRGIRRVYAPTVEHYATNVLRSLPPNAVLFAGKDGEYFQYGYVQWALGERQDVVIVVTELLAFDWYKQRLANRGVQMGNRPAGLVDDLLARDRPVFLELTPANVGALNRHPSYPYGPVVRVLPSGAPSPSLDDVVALNKQIYASFDLDEPQPGRDDEFATRSHEKYAATWNTLAQRLEAVGMTTDAAAARDVERSLAPVAR